jgi:hypothetical protein
MNRAGHAKVVIRSLAACLSLGFAAAVQAQTQVQTMDELYKKALPEAAVNFYL